MAEKRGDRRLKQVVPGRVGDWRIEPLEYRGNYRFGGGRLTNHIDDYRQNSFEDRAILFDRNWQIVAQRSVPRYRHRVVYG